MFIITCIAINVVIPTAIKLPNISGAFIAINIPCFEGVKVVLFVGLSMYLLLIM